MLTKNRDYYSIIKTRKPQVGIPIYLDAPLHDAFHKNGADRPMTYTWHTPISSLPEFGDPLAFPDELWLIAKHRRISFDIRPAHAGFLVSERFLNLLDAQQHGYFKIAKMNTVNKRGENIADYPMFYMKQKEPLDAVDRSSTQFEQEEIYGMKLFERDGSPSIGRIHHMAINAETVAGRELFETCDMSKYKCFVTGALRERMISAKLKGVDFYHIDDFPVLEEMWAISMADPIKAGWAKFIPT